MAFAMAGCASMEVAGVAGALVAARLDVLVD